MRTAITFMSLLLSTITFAQKDSIATKEGMENHNLEIGIKSGKGLYAEVNRTDSVSTAQGDTIRITTKNKLIRIITSDRVIDPAEIDVEEKLKQYRTERRNVFTYWAGVDFGFNNWMTPSGSFDLAKEDEFMSLNAGGSRFLSINFMEQKIEFGSHRAGLMTGLGWEFCNYSLSTNDRLVFNSDSTFAVPQDSIGLSKNKLRQIGVRVPLMFEFNTKRAPLPTEEEIRSGRCLSYSRKGNFHMAVGVVGSVYYDTMYKVKYRTDGESHKDRYKSSYNLLPYRLSAAVRVGYGGLTLFAEYALTPLFEDNKGPELMPFNVGITLVSFN